MGLRRRLAGLASRATVPVFAITGLGARDPVRALVADPRIRFVATPRAATVALVAGRFPGWSRAAVLGAFHALPHPRAVVVWDLGAVDAEVAALLGDMIVTRDPVEAIVATHRASMTGRRRSAPAVLADVDPAPWRGVGPYGQGGSGMTGGVPYGRPLADRADDRDGLTLDRLPLRLGPFLPPLPPLFALDVALQGGVVQAATLAGAEPCGPTPSSSDPFARALVAPVPVAELELARARSHLWWLADGLGAEGLDSLATRAAVLAGSVTERDGEAVERLMRAVRRSGALAWAAAGAGIVSRDAVIDLAAGPIAKACGIAADARTDDPAYTALGFEPVVLHGCDAAARWRVRMAETIRSLAIAARAGAAQTSAGGPVESPRGVLRSDSHPSARVLPLAAGLVVGAEWGEAVTTIVSLDLDLEAALTWSRIGSGGRAR